MNIQVCTVVLVCKYRCKLKYVFVTYELIHHDTVMPFTYYDIHTVNKGKLIVRISWWCCMNLYPIYIYIHIC